jgi:hypothetical protein
MVVVNWTKLKHNQEDKTDGTDLWHSSLSASLDPIVITTPGH